MIGICIVVDWHGRMNRFLFKRKAACRHTCEIFHTQKDRLEKTGRLYCWSLHQLSITLRWRPGDVVVFPSLEKTRLVIIEGNRVDAYGHEIVSPGVIWQSVVPNYTSNAWPGWCGAASLLHWMKEGNVQRSWQDIIGKRITPKGFEHMKKCVNKC